MKNYKTLVPGVIAGLAQIAKAFGIDIDPVILDGISAIAIAVLAYFAKDKDVTGGARGQGGTQ